MHNRIRTLASLLSLPLWLTLWAAAPATAEQSVDLYETTTLVSSQRVDERNTAARSSFAEIIVRISGQRDSVELPAIKAAIKRASSYLLEFSYGSTDEIIKLDDREIAATELHLKFSPQAIDKLLRQTGLPLWPSSRPDVLLWLVQDDRQQGRVYSSDDVLLQQLDSAASRRGLPVQHPLLDLEDQMLASVVSLWTFDSESVLEASARYGADVVVVGRFSEIARGGQSHWIANWQVLRGDGDTLLETQADSAEQVLQEGIEQIADDLASRYAIVIDESRDGALTLQLAGVNDFSGYVGAIDYLEDLAMVTTANPIYVSDGQLWLSLEAEGDVSLLLNALKRDQKFILADDVATLSASRYAPLGSLENPMRYHWLQKPVQASDTFSAPAPVFSDDLISELPSDNSPKTITADDLIGGTTVDSAAGSND